MYECGHDYVKPKYGKSFIGCIRFSLEMVLKQGLTRQILREQTTTKWKDPESYWCNER